MILAITVSFDRDSAPLLDRQHAALQQGQLDHQPAVGGPRRAVGGLRYRRRYPGGLRTRRSRLICQSAAGPDCHRDCTVKPYFLPRYPETEGYAAASGSSGPSLSLLS